MTIYIEKTQVSNEIFCWMHKPLQEVQVIWNNIVLDTFSKNIIIKRRILINSNYSKNEQLIHYMIFIVILYKYAILSKKKSSLLSNRSSTRKYTMQWNVRRTKKYERGMWTRILFYLFMKNSPVQAFRQTENLLLTYIEYFSKRRLRKKSTNAL